jgi:hypothetical protein
MMRSQRRTVALIGPLRSLREPAYEGGRELGDEVAERKRLSFGESRSGRERDF